MFYLFNIELLHNKYHFLNEINLHLDPLIISYLSYIALPMWVIIFIMFSRSLKKHKLQEESTFAKHKLITRLLFSIEDLIDKKHDIEVVFAEISRIIVNEGGYDIVWFSRYDEEKKAMIPFSSFGDRRIYLNDVSHSCTTVLYPSPTCDTYTMNQSNIINDLQHSKYKKTYQQSEQARALHSHASFIAHTSENDKFVLTVESTQRFLFDNYDVLLFERIAHLIQKAYNTIQKDALFDKVYKTANEASVVFQIQEPLLIADENMHFIQVNDALCKLVGYEEEEIIGQTPSLFHHDITDDSFFNNLINALHESRYWHGRMQVRTKNDDIILQDVTIYAIAERSKIKHYVTRYQNVKENDTEGSIEFKAYRDSLTKLPNRTLLLDRLKVAFSTNKRKAKIGALLFIDMDNFKSINDSYGHDAGDFLLIEVANRLNQIVREEDTISRLGGDEFVVLLSDLGTNKSEAASNAKIVANNILNSLARPYDFNAINLHSTPSIGISLFPELAHSYEDVLKQSDISMYIAKNRGKNNIYFYDERLDNQIQKERMIETDMRQALLSNEFIIFYQPKIDIYNNKIVGAEALIRWIHPIQGEILPLKFLPILEHSNLKNNVSNWIIQNVCKQIKLWQDADLLDDHTAIGINITTTQFQQKDFVEKFINTINLYKVKPQHLEIELIEEAMSSNYNTVAQKIEELKSYGVKFSIDDFGTGYSSLSHLKEMPISQLIISRDFINNIDERDNQDEAKRYDAKQSYTITKTIIEMAQNLGIEITAKGVERREQLRLLQELKCTNYQGYLFSKPLKSRDFEKLLKNHSSFI